MSSGVPTKLQTQTSATETSYKIENLLVASLGMILSNKRITNRVSQKRGPFFQIAIIPISNFETF